MAERLALPTSDHGVAGSNPAGGEILPEPKRCFIAQSLSCSSSHRLEMTEILLKGRKTITHPSIFPLQVVYENRFQKPTLVQILQLSKYFDMGIRIGRFLANGPGHAKMCLMAYANNKGADQYAHPRSLISTFVVRFLDSMICIIVISQVSRF